MSRAPFTSLLALAALSSFGVAMSQDLDIPFQKHVLDNGLEVVIHEDHSDPVAAVFVVYHVGSGREEVGRSGFAHLFEHLMFQGSENVGDDQHFKLVSEAGGTLNGTTNRDRTNYFETVPANQLELALWLEADRMGFLLPAINQEKLDNQREVVKNERRQNYENRPYGQSRGAIAAALYPPDHPYNWLTIGSHEDLTAAALEDVINFFQRWYGPNNATLAIGGDVDPAETMKLVEKYFGSIPRGPEVAKPLPRPVKLAQDVRLAMEDKVQLPQITFTWPGVEDGHPDAAALGLLASVLSANKAALLDKALMIDETLVTSVSAYSDASEQAGEFVITARAAPGVSLDLIEEKVRGILAKLGHDGVEPERLARLKTRFESRIINGFETVARRTSALAEANTFFDDPGYVLVELSQTLAVRPEQVDAVLERYLLDRPAVVMSVVPEGRLDMVSRGRHAGAVAHEASFDRSVQPAPGAPPTFVSPPLWHETLANGVKVTGTEFNEVPLVSISLSVPGGHHRETLETLGLSMLTADLMGEGTEDLDTVQLQDELDSIGASLRVSSSNDEITISVRTLLKHVDAAVALMGDVLLRPRLDKADFERLRTQQLASLETRGDRIRTIATNVWIRMQHDDSGPAAWPTAGTLETVASLDLEDVKRFYEQCVVPEGARLIVVGDLTPERVVELFAPITAEWTGGGAPPLADVSRPSGPRTAVFLVDKPDAPQSEIRIGMPGMTVNEPDYYPFQIMNYVLGGSFSSRINMNLREDKGYTYGARSSLRANTRDGTFTASSGVRTDVTKESVVEFMQELTDIRNGLTADETAYARDALTQAMSRQYESVGSLAGLVDSVSRNGYPDDYLEQRQQILRAITKDELTAIAAKHIDPQAMTILVVGDRETVGPSLAELGLGEVIELDIDGNVVGDRGL